MQHNTQKAPAQYEQDPQRRSAQLTDRMAVTHSEALPPIVAEALLSQIEQALGRRLDELRTQLYDLLEAQNAHTSQPQTEPLLTVQQVAEWLNVSERMVHKLRCSGELVPMKIGKSARYSAESVKAYLRSCASAKRSRARRQRAA